jgi:DNA-binding Xre family transcriptional regulator
MGNHAVGGGSMKADVMAYAGTATVAISTSWELHDKRGTKVPPQFRVIDSMKASYSKKEAFELLFPDAASKAAYREVSLEMDEEILSKIRKGELNPIRGWRILKGIDQKELCRRTGIRQPNLSRMEKLGGPAPSTGSLMKIAKALDVKLEDLLDVR